MLDADTLLLNVSEQKYVSLLWYSMHNDPAGVLTSAFVCLLMSLIGRRRSKDSISLCIEQDRKRKRHGVFRPDTIKKMFNSTWYPIVPGRTPQQDAIIERYPTFQASHEKRVPVTGHVWCERSSDRTTMVFRDVTTVGHGGYTEAKKSVGGHKFAIHLVHSVHSHAKRWRFDTTPSRMPDG